MFRKAMMAVLGLVLAFSFSGFAQAEDAGPEGAMPGHGLKIFDINQGAGHVPGMMKGKSMVATPDGGVIVLTGNKLIKYDKDLNIVKEVEVEAAPVIDPRKGCGCPKGQQGEAGCGCAGKVKSKGCGCSGMKEEVSEGSATESK